MKTRRDQQQGARPSARGNVLRVGGGDLLDGGQQAAGLAGQDRQQRQRADHHDDPLDEVGEGDREVAAQHQVDPGDADHDQQGQVVGDVEVGLEQVPQPLEDGGGVRQQEEEDDQGGEDLQPRVLEAGLQELGHGHRVEVLRHPPGPPPEDHPGQHRADQDVAQRDPEHVQPESPAQLAREADEEHRGEVGGAVGEGGDPGTDAAPAEEEIVQGAGPAHPPDPDPDHQDQEHRQQYDRKHGRLLPSTPIHIPSHRPHHKDENRPGSTAE